MRGQLQTSDGVRRLNRHYQSSGEGRITVDMIRTMMTIPAAGNTQLKTGYRGEFVFGGATTGTYNRRGKVYIREGLDIANMTESEIGALRDRAARYYDGGYYSVIQSVGATELMIGNSSQFYGANYIYCVVPSMTGDTDGGRAIYKPYKIVVETAAINNFDFIQLDEVASDSVLVDVKYGDPAKVKALYQAIYNIDNADNIGYVWENNNWRQATNIDDPANITKGSKPSEPMTWGDGVFLVITSRHNLQTVWQNHASQIWAYDYSVERFLPVTDVRL